MKPLTFLWIISTVLTGIIIRFLSGLVNTDLFSWGFFFFLPAGAFVTAYLNLFILGIFYRIFKIYPKGGLLFNSVLSTLIIIFMLAFYDPAQTLVKDKSSVIAEILTLFTLLWSWLLWGIKIIGYWLITNIEYNNLKKLLKEEKDGK